MNTLSRLLIVFSLCACVLPAQWTRQRQEEFLKTAKVLQIEELPVGVTNSRKATLSDGATTHDAHIQTVDERKDTHETRRGVELNFRDSYKFNIAAYRLDQLIGLDMAPTSVERKAAGGRGAWTWWVDDSSMMEIERYKKNIRPPDQKGWNRQMFRARVFNELVYNTDANLQNIVIDKNWRIWLIDFTRAFRTHKNLRAPKTLRKIDRKLLASLEGLSEEAVTQELGDLLTDSELRAILARRDAIVAAFREKIARAGESAVLFDF